MSEPCGQHTRDPGACARVPRDPGASALRTRLAWRRTGLSASAVALLALRPAFAPGAGPAEWLAAAASMTTWAAIVAIALHRGRDLRTRFPGPAPRPIRAYAFLIVALAVLGGWVVML
ncbi:DUF202 domain-containing protein [Actinoplanes hulinensis]|uniref:Uncharacterized membrane protein YidH (DUF202 family) n=2 Tax=Actinoplanes TaxID=1865 RepID=A0A7W5FCG0_9ACTN|nr:MULTISPECIES: DUF202 domain-containing protein [Actinoplanes]MBB3093236.1 uncharacterized membrane protein YidH (DUF202 family) [Actinoplanes campanulatus]MBW6438982.1 DUF202 domain-containing protein [Actinoplanes hulinensis]GGN02147.1 hypothetical protein GCM10010109_07970 [Actinoplanes campanulatus]GID33669.1 hypothetical protein Aca09nite_01750 [Actinoplanes campanulatus]GID48958.1 hypothetical protein Aca07nite_62330 [Actinoplanes capillaceus]